MAWQKAQDLAVDIYNEFGKMKDFGFRDQICRAVISISKNIAEGFDRSTNPDFARFLYFSLSSCSEVKSMLYLAHRLMFIDIERLNHLLKNTRELSRMIYGLLKSLNAVRHKPKSYK